MDQTKPPQLVETNCPHCHGLLIIKVLNPKNLGHNYSFIDSKRSFYYVEIKELRDDQINEKFKHTKCPHCKKVIIYDQIKGFVIVGLELKTSILKNIPINNHIYTQCLLTGSVDYDKISEGENWDCYNFKCQYGFKKQDLIFGVFHGQKEWVNPDPFM